MIEKQAPLRPRHRLPRGRLQDPYRARPGEHGHPAQLRRQPASHRRPHQHRRRTPHDSPPPLPAASGRPRTQLTCTDPRSTDFAIALGAGRLGALRGRVQLLGGALHTSLMSVTNAISGIVVVGALLQTGHADTPVTVLSFAAILLASINISGGFAVTRRRRRRLQTLHGHRLRRRAEPGVLPRQQPDALRRRRTNASRTSCAASTPSTPRPPPWPARPTEHRGRTGRRRDGVTAGGGG